MKQTAMPIKFLENLGSQVTEQWAVNLLTPAFVFWFGGVLAWLDRWGWHGVQDTLVELDDPLQLVVLIGGLIVIVASGFVIQRFDLAVLRFFEGYWPTWMDLLRTRLQQRSHAWAKRQDDRWQALQLKQETQPLTPQELEELSTIDWRLRQVPTRPERMMPTRLGNILRAAESLPETKYGLDAVICWPRLWMVLPDKVKEELQGGRSQLNQAARVWLWSFLFLIWGIWAWWAIPAGIMGMWFTYGWMIQAAEVYGDLVESTFDLHRIKLYQGLNWPLPQNPQEEAALGRSLTEYLWRGSRQSSPMFVYPDDH